MTGRYTIKISDSRVRYQFELIRNITLVQGDSGTGKTTLFDMIMAYANLREKSGVRLNCDKKCIALRPDSDWQHELRKTADSIVFIDEDMVHENSEKIVALIAENMPKS